MSSSPPASPNAPLAGVRVADLSRVLAGPYCTMVLADLGAEVVKVERPGGGDETRSWGPPFAGGESAYFLAVNRGKRSVALDLGAPEGRDLALELCAGADVVVENFRAGGAERLGLGYEDVRSRNPETVYCSITGFGLDREPFGRAGYDFVLQAESGLMSITGPPGGEPHKVGVALVDVMAGLHAAVAVLAAVHSGRGGRVEVPLLDSALASLVNVAQGALVTGAEPARHGNAHPSIVPYQDFATASGRLAVAAPNDGLFRKLCSVLVRAELAVDPRFATNPDRVANRAALVVELEAALSARPAAEWVQALSEAGVPAGEIRSVPAALEAAAAAGRAATVGVDHPAAGRIELVASPIHMDGMRPAGPPPLLGQHTAEVLAELGCSPDRVDELVARGVAARA